VTPYRYREETMIGGAFKRILPYMAMTDAFCLTYGDGVADIDITESIAFHRREGCDRDGSSRPAASAINHQAPASPAPGKAAATATDQRRFFVLSPQVANTSKARHRWKKNR